MERFRNILVVHGGGLRGEAAVGHAIRLAAEQQADLAVATIVPETFVPPRLFADGAPSDSRAEARMRANSHLVAARRRGLQAKPVVLEGKPGTAIVNEVARGGYDLVILSDNCQAPLFGAIDTVIPRVVRHCPCPVWVVKSRGTQMRRVVAAIGCADPKQPLDDLDARAVVLAAGLARAAESSLEVLRPWDFRGVDLERSRSEMLPTMYARMHNEHHLARLEGVQQLLTHVGLADEAFDIHLSHETPEAAIVQLDLKAETDLLVMGTRSAQGFARFFSYDPAEALLAGIRCSMVVVKPGQSQPHLAESIPPLREHPRAFGQRLGATSGTLSRRIR